MNKSRENKERKTNPKVKRFVMHYDDSESSCCDGDELFIDMVKGDQNTEVYEVSAMSKINGKNVKFKLDTGADCNVISRTLFEHIRSIMKS